MGTTPGIAQPYDTTTDRLSLQQAQTMFAGVIIDGYWKQDAYFEGNWWQDEEKRTLAFEMLLYEATLAGGINLLNVNDGAPSRVYAIQTLMEMVTTGDLELETVRDLL